MSLYKKQREQVKEQVYTSAVSLFREKGYQNVSIEEIAKTVGIAKGTFYNFYPSKKDILMLWAEQEFQKLDFASIINPSKTIEENLYSTIRFTAKAIESEVVLFKAFLNELIRIQDSQKSSKNKFDFKQIFSMVFQGSADFDSIGNSYFEEKISVLNNSLFLGLINWFNENEDSNGLEQYMVNLARVCLYGILKNQDLENRSFSGL